MGRLINHFILNGVQGENSSLSVSYNYRGQNAGHTSFHLEGENGSVSFELNSKEEAASLANYLLGEINDENRKGGWAVPSFDTTGYALKVYCNGQAIKTLYDCAIFNGGVDCFHYNFLRKAFLEYNSDDYYFVVYALKDNGIARDTLEKIIDACVAYQEGVLISGDLRLFRPMTQVMIAEQTGYDNTAVSRAVREVRVFTAHRNYSLDRYSERVSLDFPSLFNDEINGMSSVGVKLKIRSLIESEDKTNPYTDDELTQELKRFGYDIARRTVMKYRADHLGIPNSNQRRIR